MPAKAFPCFAESSEHSPGVKACVYDTKPDWVVVDGYQFQQEYFESLQETKSRVMVIDDCNHRGTLSVDAVLNGNPYAQPDFYNNFEPKTLRLVGACYALLNSEFRFVNRAPKAGKALITFGGGSQPRSVEMALAALSRFRQDFHVTVVGDYSQGLQSAPNLQIEHVPFTDQMPQIMADACFAISGGGSTLLELDSSVLPTVAVEVAENQRLLLAIMEKEGNVISAGTAESPHHRDSCEATSCAFLGDEGASSSRLVDGFGADRTIQRMFDFPVRLRPCRKEDMMRLFDWANDPLARSNSLNSDVIPLEHHKNWYHERLNNPDTFMQVAIDGAENPVGVVRLEGIGYNASLSFLIAPEHRGRGFAKPMLELGLRIFRNRNPSQR